MEELCEESQDQKDEKIKNLLEIRFQDWYEHFASESQEYFKSKIYEKVCSCDVKSLFEEKSAEEIEQFWVEIFWNVRGQTTFPDEDKDRDAFLRSFGFDPIGGESQEEKDVRINNHVKKEFQE